MFEKTKSRVDTLVNDRITAPVRTAVILSAVAFTLAVIALAVAAGGRSAGH